MGEQTDIPAMMAEIGERARVAARALATASADSRSRALTAAAASIRANTATIRSANAGDLTAAEARGTKGSFLDRLLLNDDRISLMARGLEDIAALDDPLGAEIAAWDRPNGLRISRIRTPIGVIGVIYESRPNVTADAGGLCLKSGNASILRGGSESFNTSGAIMACLGDGLRAANLPVDAIQCVATTDRAAVGEMLRAERHIDVIVPRGGKSLIERVSAESRVPLFKHLEGICHTYIDAGADPEKARSIVLNAKMRRTGICGSMETLLVDRPAIHMLSGMVDDLTEAGCEIRGDDDACTVDGRIVAAREEDWDTEYLDSILSVRVVDGVEEAIEHITRHGSQHTDAIITEDTGVAEIFLRSVDSAIVMLNASTQFADGGEFGMGAEIGISTGRLHARGPVGVEQLTSFKYVVRGHGQIRP